MESIITLIIIAAIITMIIKIAGNKRRRLEQLKLAYHQALKGSNKKLALDTGRAYYSALRKNNILTIYDEQAITNDLSTMSSPAFNL